MGHAIRSVEFDTLCKLKHGSMPPTDLKYAKKSPYTSGYFMSARAFAFAWQSGSHNFIHERSFSFVPPFLLLETGVRGRLK